MKYGKTKDLLNQLVADLSQFSVVIHQHIGTCVDLNS